MTLSIGCLFAGARASGATQNHGNRAHQTYAASVLRAAFVRHPLCDHIVGAGAGFGGGEAACLSLRLLLEGPDAALLLLRHFRPLLCIHNFIKHL